MDDASSPPASPPPPPTPPASSSSLAPSTSQGGNSELRRKRDALAEQVTKLHWDLGGLAYEMAVRDHFRLDVLVRRAALLQESDAELAEIERLLRLEENAGAGPTARGSGLSLPSPKISALLVLMFIGFGAILGGVAGSPTNYSLAASSGRPLKLILPPAPSAIASTATEALPPTAESEATPSPSESPESSSEGNGSAAGKHNGATAGKGGSGSGSGGGQGGGENGSGAGKAGSGGGQGGGKNGGGAGKAGSGSGKGGSEGSRSGGSKLPPIKHVFVIMLSDQPYASVFGPSSSSSYLSQTLEHRGELLARYYAVAHQQLANEIALLSGQGPTPETATNCPIYSNIAPATVSTDEQVLGHGCVYPSSTETLAGQLAAKHLTWKAYLEGMDEGAPSAGGACAHPALGAADPTSAQTLPAGQTYATWQNPFVYFSSVTSSPACAGNDVGLNRLASDLKNPKSTPSFSYVAPDSCHNGSPTPCASGAPTGLLAAEGFLKKVVGEITSSKAYKENGLLVITVDEAPSSGALADSSSCCGQPQFPNLLASTTGLAPEGGGQVGALLLSPFVKPGISQEPYNHFSLLRTIEDLFGLSHLGYAGASRVSSFGSEVFSGYTYTGH